MRDALTQENPQDRLLLAQMDFLARSAAGSCVFTFLLAVLLSVGLWQHTPMPVNIGWTAYMLVLTSARFMHARRYLAQPGDSARSRRFEGQFTVAVLASGFGWGAAAIILFPFESIAHQSFLSFALAGTTASAITLYASLKWALRFYLGLTLVPLAAVHFSQPGEAHLAMGALVVIYIGLMFRFVSLANSTLVNALALRDENRLLIEQLKASKTQSDQANQKLKAEIGVRAETEKHLIEARDRAEQAARAKSEFLATMSHEIRTPMNGVLGMAELLLGTELSTRQHNFADTIRRSGTALLAIINDILDYSKIEAGKLEIASAPFDLRQLTEDTMVFFAEQAQRKRIELITDYPSDHHAAFRGDPERIRQVLMNLLGNAVKFTSRGEIRLNIATVATVDKQTTLKISVSDTGVGIAPEHQAHIFEIFQQADGSTTRKFGGTGLGLAISKQLVELMGGEIGVTSAPHRGSTFWFTLSLVELPAGAVHQAEEKPADFSGLRILVADRNETNRDILVQQLEAWGIRVYGVDSARLALRYLNKAYKLRKPFDIMIFDHQLGNVDGLQLARKIRSFKQFAHTRLVMLSSVNMLEQTGQWLTAGIDNYVGKPIRQAELRGTLSAVARPASATKDCRAAADETDAASLGAHVLVAEDNPVNQELVQIMLENLGCTSVLVEDGQSAYEAIAEAPLDALLQPYDLVLMDCQMPVLDGFEATRRLRAWEARQAGRPPLPIIALTANAMQGDRERCLAAGMTDYVTKPFAQDQLTKVIKRWLTLDRESVGKKPSKPVRAAAAPSPAPNADAAVAALEQGALDSIRALQRDNTPDILARVVGLYLKNAPAQLAAMQQAVADNDNDALHRAAHSLKSASANLGATKLAALCQDLEHCGRDGRASSAMAALDIAAFELDAVMAALADELAAKAA